jgi:hypothetical protein
MADLKALEDRLKEIGCNFRFWGRAEIKELANVLLPKEVVEHCINGQYEGGFALLVATDQRVLLIDKKPMYLTLEDIRFDMIAEVDFNHRLMNASIFICTPSKSLRFVAYNNARLRKLFHFVQQRVMEIRQHYQHAAEVQQQYQEQLLQPTMPQLGPSYFQQQIPAAINDQPVTALLTQSVPEAQLVQPQPQYNHPIAQRTVAPIISAYTRLPIMSRQRRFLGSRAMNSPMPTNNYPGSLQQ